MIRTPVKSLVRNVSQIFGRPPTPKKSTRRQFLGKQSSTSHQMASILYEQMQSTRPVPIEEKENSKDDEMLSIDNSLHPSEDPRSFSSEDDFIKTFVGWLEKTNGKIDKSTRARMEGDLCQIVGKYELELAQTKK